MEGHYSEKSTFSSCNASYIYEGVNFLVMPIVINCISQPIDSGYSITKVVLPELLLIAGVQIKPMATVFFPLLILSTITFSLRGAQSI